MARAVQAVRQSLFEQLESRRLLAAATFEVTTGADEVNGVAASGSLRAAIIAANANPGSTIAFDQLPGLTPIVLDAPLPPITGAGTIIDGTTAPNQSVEIDGNPNLPSDHNAANTGFTGFDVQTTAVTIQGLTLRYFDQAIILDTGSSGATIQNNYIGDVNNSGAGTNQIGIEITGGSSGNTIGSLDGTDGNVISGNLNNTSAYTGTAILVEDPQGTANNTTTPNMIEGNTIGLTAVQSANQFFNQATAAPNGRGIVLSDVTNTIVEDNQIGATTYSFGPSGNGTGTGTSGGGAGIVTLTSGTDKEFGNTIEDNTVGIAGNGFEGFYGTSAIPSQIGVYVDNGAATTAGDTFTGNNVAFNTGAGFDVFGSVNTISSNSIQDNGGSGVVIEGSAERNTISQNSITGNGATSGGDYNLGIEFGDNGNVLNTPFSGRTGIGANGLTPYPTLSETSNIDTYTIQATITGNPNTEYQIEFFTNSAALASPTGYGQGDSYLPYPIPSGATTSTPVIITTDASGFGTASEVLPVSELEDDVTATATNISAFNAATNPDAGATSEFSQNIAVGGLSGAPNSINLQIGSGASLYETDPNLDKIDAYFTSSDTNRPFTATANYGDGTGLQFVPIAANGDLTLIHTYPGTVTHTYVATVTVYDNGAAAKHEFDVTVTAGGPSHLKVKSLTHAKPTIATPFLALASFIDPGSAVGDLFRVSVSYGDGTKVFRATTQHTEFHLAHQYTHVGRYELVVTIIDDGGSATTYKEVINVLNVPADEKKA